MAGRKQKVPAKKEVKRYVHSKTKRTNNPPAGLANQEQSTILKRQRYSFDPHLDPQLQWSGKQENSSFDIDTVSIHIHEQIDPSTILNKVKHQETSSRMDEFFDTDENNLPLHKAIDFYKHEQGWSNRMIAGDSLLVMNSLLVKEKMEGKMQMVYFDPPYGIKYGSNFQPFVNKRDVSDSDRDDDLTTEPEMVKAFRDTWELGIHSYLSYLRDRLLLARKLLTESGSIFVQISNENVHRVRIIMDEIFGSENFVSLITWRRKTNSRGTKIIGSVSDYIVWYTKDKTQIKYHKLFEERDPVLGGVWNSIEESNGNRRKLKPDEIKNPKKILPTSRVFRTYLLAPSHFNPKHTFTVTYKGKKYIPPYNNGNRSWKHNENGIKTLIKNKRVWPTGNTLGLIGYWDEFPYNRIDNLWDKMSFSSNKKYVVETSPDAISRCMLMTTDPGDLVFDPTCGSGTTAYVAEKYGRRWITCDTSKVALNLAQRRLITANFKYYQLTHSDEGICGGFNYKTESHITSGLIVNDEPPTKEIFYNMPLVDKTKKRISGPFTVEAIPSPVGKSIDVLHKEFKSTEYDYTSYQQEWREEILKTGIRIMGNQKIEFLDIEQHPTTKYLHAIAKTKEDKSKTAVISFGPPYSAMTQEHVEFALQESETLRPRPDIVVFVAMQFDPEALKNIKQTKWKDMTILSVNMNTDLLVKDLKKKQSNSESFWEIGQPDAKLEKQKDGTYVVKVIGFDYYDTSTGQIVSGGESKISMWLLDTDYDGRSIYPEQVFFTMDVSQKGNEMKKLAKTLHAEIDPDLIEKYTGFESLPFEAKPNQKIAVKIIDDKGMSMLKVLTIEK